MRRLPTALLLAGMTSSLVVLPTTAVPSADARPVAPSVREITLSGIDATALAQSPAPEESSEHGRSVAARESRTTEPALKPLVATQRTRTSPFSAVGVTWTADPTVEDVAVQVRTRTGGRWSDWTEIEVQGNSTGDPGTPEARASRVGSDPLYVGPSDGVQVRVDGGADKPRNLRVVLIDPGTSPADGSAASATRTFGGSVAHAAERQPAYVSRASWGADESLRSCTPSLTATIKGGILHTTVTGNEYTPEQSPAVMRSMYAYHTKSLGWCDLGYNMVVDKYGTLFEGRYGGIDKPVLGAHTGGFNSYTFGVSMMGNQDVVAPTPAMLTILEKVFAWKLGLYGLNPLGTVTYTSAGGSATKYPYGTVVTMPVISGHRDYSTKSCPGNYAYPLLPSIRTAVAARMTASSVAPAATTLAVTTSPRTIVYGGETTISGGLTTTDGTPLAGKAVKLYVRKRGTTTWGLLSTRTTASNGTFSGTHAALSSVEYQARFAAGSGYAAAVDDTRVYVRPIMTASLSAKTVRLGSTLTLRGTVTPAHPGDTVLRQQYVDGKWVTLATATLSSSSSYSFSFKPTTKGTKYYRVYKQTDTDHAWVKSATQKLAVS